MMNNKEFFLKLNALYQKNQSFISYRMPDSNVLKLNYSTEKIIPDFFYNQNGFVIMPFKNDKGYVIPKDKIFQTTIQKETSSINNKNKDFTKKMQSKKGNYIKIISHAIDEILKTKMEKVVLSQSFDFDGNEINYLKYFDRLLRLYHNAFCYLFYHPEEGFWIGASPETLLKLENKKVITMALAGTKKPSESNWGEKEIIEQKLVETYLKNNLTDICSEIKIGKRKTVLAGKIEHLKSVISGSTDCKPIDLVKAIHPTPAVGGVPKELALSFIEKSELQKRSFYSGYLGIVENNNCNLFVNLRCAQIKGKRVKIFVGGGITKESEPEKEWEEIVVKSQTMLNILFV